MYDKNGDSKITLDEFGDVIKNLGLTPSEEQLTKLMQEIDLDGENQKIKKKFELNESKVTHIFRKRDG